ncbi:hypothetical protein AT00_17260 [Pseudoalteromonas lipolytica SCSIO 04301]|uniref:Prepilin-type N-terminal cleavage/methylation domain-containing protein n=1 Tax=Pseudoalteromonas lipolytica TaxID=570156 RepID=A0ABY1GIE7_9GAMM|nr:prepilin-type N-terminal cleavage/methylation domain-containing protein [Pseudoalteromonas lipolytica]EWH04898.1 hypothetical protein AT00_17260 [Pseudoalteromonas lipolytica SCSIO 04301]MBE0349616.1 hypothetical protein [Pseudoalteromonas lipolytica LMEB 39]SFT78087.1 prepilin-type N-terminal cleavage/methylation domain-containing protein [Pseudoalteromonas lipolytica]
MKSLKFNKGMTLIEVLIASIILFIAISALSFVSRSMLLHESRLERAIDRALLAELIKDEVSYRYQYEKQNTGTYTLDDHEYQWRVDVLDEKPPVRFISSESESNENQQNGRVILYSVVILDNDRELLRVKDVFWQG